MAARRDIVNQVPGALSSIRVLDLSRVRAGPTCVRMLADFGADVIRIEPPAGVDPNDTMFAEKRRGGDFQNLNRNKRGLSLNLKQPEGVKIFRELVATSDVVVENWRPDVKVRLGVDFQALSRLNPKIILASISGYGQDGPYAERPGFDQIIQGISGLMSVTGTPASGPLRAGIAVADSSAGLYTALGILIALFEREKSGRGQWVHASLLHSQIAMLDFQAARYLVDGDVPKPTGNDHPTAAPMGMFRGNDGVFNIGVSGSGQWEALCRAVERVEWINEEKFHSSQARVKNRLELNTELQAIFLGNNVKHWVGLLNSADIPAGPIYTIPEMFDDVQVKHLRVVQPVRSSAGPPIPVISQPINLTRTPAQLFATAPDRGEHTDEILHELGYLREQIDWLRRKNVV
ncbi:CoA transferase [Bradyrhizobium sp. 177]|uniref:CaiB/BaiF CoA transferase family protein n=1 Tax=Bradyrhizobium sp. 177 TaxID=2782647 RepID=UPI001FF8A4A5|nr:CoA transferase [Bradyrhizobium sp. 177]MCK1554765.1 CoA transferase [Bradyrhizobium sp. 177]